EARSRPTPRIVDLVGDVQRLPPAGPRLREVAALGVTPCLPRIAGHAGRAGHPEALRAQWPTERLDAFLQSNQCFAVVPHRVMGLAKSHVRDRLERHLAERLARAERALTVLEDLHVVTDEQALHHQVAGDPSQAILVAERAGLRLGLVKVPQ